MPAEVLFRVLCLSFLIAGFCRRERVVSVSHGVQKPGIRVFLPFPALIGCNSLLQRAPLFPVDQPAGQMSAAQHQVEVIQLLQVIFVLCQGLDHFTALIVTEEQNVRQFQGGAPPDRHAGRNPFGHGLLGRPHLCIDFTAVVVLFQIYPADEAAADLTA